MVWPGIGHVNAAREDYGVFVHQVRDALAHLYDLPYTRAHPLTALLRLPDAPDSGVFLRDLLLEAIERLRPSGSSAADASAWRRYRALSLRYIDQGTTHDTADALALSDRQARRELRDAIEALAVILRRGPQESRNLSPEAEPTREDASYSETATIGDTLEGVRQTLQPLLAERAVALDIRLPISVAQSPIARLVLRQALLAILVEGIDVGHTDVAIAAMESADEAQLEITMEGGSTGRLQSVDAVARALIEGSGGGVRVRAATCGDALEIVLPIRRATVLLVDDDLDFVRLFRRCLVGSPYTVLTTRHAEEVLAYVSTSPPDVIVLDVVMPSLDGWELLQRIQESAPGQAIPVLVCSVLHEESLARALGAAGYLAKPVNPPSLLAALERCRTARPRAGGRATHAGSP